MALIQPTISWEAIVSESTTYTGDHNYTCKLTKTNPNDPGYGDLQVGYYIVDFVGHIFEITGINFGGDSESVIVHDMLERNEEEGPYGLREAYIYGSLSEAALIAQAKLNRLDESAEDFVRSLGIDPKVVDGILFNTNYDESNPELEVEGALHWNSKENTVDIHTGYGSILQIGQELHIKVYNNSGETINEGTAVYPNGIFGEYATVGKALSSTHETIAVDYGLTTTTMLDGEYGFVTWFGKVRGVDTSSYNAGDIVYISSTTAGELTNIRPIFPNYDIKIGIVLISAVEGEIFVTSRDNVQNTFNNFWNGAFRESFDFRVSSDGVTITGTLEPANGHSDMTMIFSDGFTMFDTSPAATITLIPGTDTIPQSNYVYIPKSTKVLTVSTSDWPTTIEHIKVAQLFLQSASTTQQTGALRNQNWNDHIQDTHNGMGHLLDIGVRIRQLDAQWDSGCEGTLTDIGGDIYVKNTSGIVYQMHRQNFPVIDMTQYNIDAVNTINSTFTISGDGDLSSLFTDGRLIKVNNSTGNDKTYTVSSTIYSAPDFIITVEETIPSAIADGTIGDDIHIVNHNTTPYLLVTNLSDLTNDASGNPLLNTSFSIVVWGVNNKSGEPAHLMCNLPLSTYNKNFPEQAINDANAASVYNIPKAFQGVGFLIARFTIVNSGGVWSLYETQDLRGFIPNTTAGAGAGASGITTFTGLTDTPSTHQAYGVLQGNSTGAALEYVNDIRLDSITEYTTNNGIWIDGLGIKDTGINFEVGATTRIFKDGSNNLSFTDAITGTKTLAELTTGGGGLNNISDDSGNDLNIGNASLSGTVTMTAIGSDTDVGVTIVGKGAGNVSLGNSLAASDKIETWSLNGLYIRSASGGNPKLSLAQSGSSKFELSFNNTSKNVILDATSSSETNSSIILQPKGTGVVTTSSIHTANISGNDDVITKGYADTNYSGGSGSISFGSDNQIPFTNSTTDDFDYGANFAWDSERLTIYDNSSDFNLLMGFQPGNSITVGSYNTMIGFRPGYSTTEGNYNSFFGYYSGYTNTNGTSNTYYGSYSGHLGVGDGNVCIGFQSGYDETGDNKLFIDNQRRTNEATGRTNSLIYGVFNSTVANQELHLNAGVIMIDDIPTSDPSNTGQIWNDSGILKVSA